ncbi:MAG TPA: type 2 isopentenyl-diphosphate Delta-isomerase [Myxococcales bacterium]
MSDETAKRKDAHLDLCATGDVEPKGNDPLFADVQLVHEALPDLSADEVIASTEFMGRKLSLPLLVTGMTGGTERTGALNRDLALVAQELGLAFGVGSQRAMLTRPESASTYQVRKAAPNVALIGNVGLWQARELGVDGVRRLMDAIEADAMAVHLNVGQELIQPEGDRDFRKGLDTIAALATALGDRLIVKETGCGIGPATARRLVDAGVKAIDVSGLGGTSWVRVEMLRAEGPAREVGQAFSGWGIPTAACVASVSRAVDGRARIVASGGVRDGLDAAKAIALGASLAGTALPVLRAYQEKGLEGARAKLTAIGSGLKTAMLLTGSRTIEDLRRAPRVVGPALERWLSALEAGVSGQSQEGGSSGRVPPSGRRC